MNVKVEDISSVKKQLSFEVPAARVDEEIESAYKKLAKTAKIKGFRQGKVPRAVLERHYAASVESQVLERLVSDSYFKALEQEKILAVSGPEITDGGTLEKGKAYTFQAQVEVQPEVEAKDYLELPLKKETFKDDETLVGARLEEMRLGNAKLEATDREEAQSGDTVIIDFEGFVNGVAFENGAAQDHSLDLGSNSFIPGFEEQLVGMNRGEEGEVEVTFPLDYAKKDLAGQDAMFKVKIKEIKEKVLPELDDEFAAQVGLASLEDLRTRVKEAHESQERSRIEQEFRDQLVDLLIERNPLEVPDGMIQSQLDHMLENLSNRMQSQGTSLESMGMTPDSFKEVYREIAVKQVKGNLLLEAIALQESIQVEESEIEEKLEEIAEKHNASKEMVMNFYSDESRRRGLVAQLAEEKVILFLTGKANVEMVDESIAADAEQGNDKE